ncbi:uncharacterized protein LOC135926188 isoform X2 [Gordionus sp. m RMFG-2023]|uniref:uncharacterized protein LOC135926188 isoform X2 n=1 Tax=Gordionus sp. m RMFG-2023 TaxID=3053472 RepID=UPI0031FCB56D
MLLLQNNISTLVNMQQPTVPIPLQCTRDATLPVTMPSVPIPLQCILPTNKSCNYAGYYAKCSNPFTMYFTYKRCKCAKCYNSFTMYFKNSMKKLILFYSQYKDPTISSSTYKSCNYVGYYAKCSNPFTMYFTYKSCNYAGYYAKCSNPFKIYFTYKRCKSAKCYNSFTMTLRFPQVHTRGIM